MAGAYRLAFAAIHAVVLPGSRIEEVATAAIAMADQTEAPVTFEFHWTRYTIEPYTSLEDFLIQRERDLQDAITMGPTKYGYG